MNENTSTQTLAELMGDRDMFNDRFFTPSSDAILLVRLMGYSDNPKFTLEMNLSAQEMFDLHSDIMGKLFRISNPDHAWYSSAYNVKPSVNRILQREFKQKILDALNLDFFDSGSEAGFSITNAYNIHTSEYVPLLSFNFSLDTTALDDDARVLDLPVTAVREFFASIVDMFEKDIRSGEFFQHVLDVWSREENSVNNPKEAFLSMCNENIAQLDAGVS